MGIKISEINKSKVLSLILTITFIIIVNWYIWTDFPNSNIYVRTIWTFSSLIVSYYYYYIVLHFGNKLFNHKVGVINNDNQ